MAAKTGKSAGSKVSSASGKASSSSGSGDRRYWLVKTEPDVFSFDDLLASKDRTTYWEGVRNYQARNFMRDGMRVGDGVLVYHSNAKPPGVVGVARVVREAYPDHTQFDPDNTYFDPKAKAESPTWLMVDIQGVRALPRFLPLPELRDFKPLDGMELLRKGSRLSVQPVTEREWKLVLELGGLAKDPLAE